MKSPLQNSCESRIGSRVIPGLKISGRLELNVNAFFPQHATPRLEYFVESLGVSDMVLKEIVIVRPELLKNSFKIYMKA